MKIVILEKTKKIILLWSYVGIIVYLLVYLIFSAGVISERKNRTCVRFGEIVKYEELVRMSTEFCQTQIDSMKDNVKNLEQDKLSAQKYSQYLQKQLDTTNSGEVDSK